ncbi:MAG TPA: S-layer homology domain-containing protein [Clostridiales bacterium]|nr:S-layer homology domain-containing protein [Clostridiales bacterium]HPV01669.1 S-layer homology domain-containing protein [Clostridiales bacterium]
MDELKRKTALILVLVLVLSVILPAQGFAADMDKELENAIRTAKSKFSIPEDYKFSSNIYASNTQIVYELSWRSQDTVNTTYINVSVDGKGNILYYSRHSRSDYRLGGRLPELSREEARKKAEQYIEHIAPGLLNEIEYREEYSDSVMDISYYLTYYRVVDGVPYYNNTVSLSINRDTGELMSYSRNWTDDVEFPSPEGAISPEEAKKAYRENLGIRLIYSYTTTEDNMIRAVPLYATVYDNNAFVIDAYTGKKQRLLYYSYAEPAYLADSSEEKTALQMAAGASIRLTPEELKAIGEASELISLEKAEKLARGAEFLGITEKYELKNYYLSTSWPDNREYLWSLQFSTPAGEDGIANDYVSVSINARTEEITSFYFYGSTPDSVQKQPLKDLAGARADAEAFLKKYYPRYFEQMEYNKINEEYAENLDENQKSYIISYTRLADGVPFPDNGVTISYDNLKGKIASFSLSWFNAEFPSVENVISLDEAYDILFDEIGLGLEYKYRSGKVIPLGAEEKQESAKAALVYALAPEMPHYIDAVSGKIVYRDGSEYKEPKKISYTDIKGHFAEKQISVLADFGIYLEGTEFRPDDAIVQKDFLSLLAKTLNYYGPAITEKSSREGIDELYVYLIREGVVRENEKAPDSAVTREEAVKFIIRALKYDKVADIRGIFSVSFRDSESISGDLYGYVAIASGLGIVKGDGIDFRPKKNTTRAEAAVMIYNYLRL